MTSKSAEKRLEVQRERVIFGWVVFATDAKGRERAVSRIYGSADTARTVSEMLARADDDNYREPRVVERGGYEPESHSTCRRARK